MAEKSFGKNKILYLVKCKDQTRIELHIHHDNQETTKTLRAAQGAPCSLLTRFDAFSHSNTSAEYWLSEVMKDYRSFFERNAVDFLFH
ncbi:MAG TPA: hypothetical protein PK530_00845 [Anaerolineales bacterium]|nr:hypothetical protein [Anaerolineales bacterium]